MKKRIFLLILGVNVFYIGTSQNRNSISEFNNDILNIGYGIKMSSDSTKNTFSISGVDASVFGKSTAIDPTKALYGKIAGLNVYQGSGSSADNVSSLSFHGSAPLVLVDGFPRKITDVNPQEIETCFLLKDATATALYGMKGANGVLVVNTKRGIEGKMNIKVEYDFGVNTSFRAPEFADAYMYATSLNTALQNDGLSPRYNNLELDAFRTGKYPYEFPNVDWWKHTMNNVGFTHNLKFSFVGGSSKFRYFTSVSYYRDLSMLKDNTSDSRYNISPTDTRLGIRTNIDSDITKSTFFKINVAGNLKEINESRYGRNAIFNKIYATPSAAFPIFYDNDIYGGNSTYGENNPVALLKDYGQRRTMLASLMVDASMKQELDALTKGLSAEVSVSYDNTGSLSEESIKEYRYMDAGAKLSPIDGTLSTNPIIYGLDSEILEHNLPFESLMMRSDFQAKISYERLFGNKHQLDGALIYDMQSYTNNGRNTSNKNLSYMAVASYMYDNRYVINAVFNRSGSAYLKDGNKFRNYPAVSFAWNINNEKFLKNVSLINRLKFRTSYGLSGWDEALSHELWRFSYTNGGGYNFGDNATGVGGLTEGVLPILSLQPVKVERFTSGIDFSAFGNRLNLEFDGFYERRSNMLVSGTNSVSEIIGIGVGQLCEGTNKYKGVDFSLNWDDNVSDIYYHVGMNGSYLNSEVVNNNQAFQQYDYLYQKGNRVGQMYGLEAIGFFTSQLDINNSPKQTFSEVRPGDIKYKDQNGDHIIDSNDVVKMFGSNIPRFYFGVDLGLRYKGFEISADFQGLTGKTINLLDSPLYNAPLVNNGNISATYLNREICWSPENKQNATMPRLTSTANNNNYRNSSFWYRDGSFIKLRNLYLAYTFSKKDTKFADIKFFLQGNNLFSLDNIHFADPELLGIAYPSVRSYSVGIKLIF